MNPVDEYFQLLNRFGEEMQHLREIVRSTGLSETLKWNQPCYTFQNQNIVILGTFKDSFILSFFKGSLLEDKQGLLEFPGPNARVAKLFRFREMNDIHQVASVIPTYIHEAIEIEKAGLKTPVNDSTQENLPPELETKFKADTNYLDAWNKLTPGRQRGLLLHFNGAKQSATRQKRIHEAWTRIQLGKGIHDCICGKSKRMPRCDGSHSK